MTRCLDKENEVRRGHRQRTQFGTLAFDLEHGLESSPDFDNAKRSEEGLLTLQLNLNEMNRKVLQYQIPEILQHRLSDLMGNHYDRRDRLETRLDGTKTDSPRAKSQFSTLLDLLMVSDLLQVLERGGAVVPDESNVDSGRMRRLLNSEIGRKAEMVLQELTSSPVTKMINTLLRSGDATLTRLAAQAVTSGNLSELAVDLLAASHNVDLPTDVRRLTRNLTPSSFRHSREKLGHLVPIN